MVIAVVLVAAMSFDVLTYRKTLETYLSVRPSANGLLLYNRFLCRSAISNLPHGNLIEGN
jgi:hypothetical protein